MVSFASNRPTDEPRRLFVVDEQGSQLAEFLQDPLHGGLKFGMAHFERVLLSLTVANDGYAIVTYDANGQPHTIVTVSSNGQTQVERIDLRAEGNEP